MNNTRRTLVLGVPAAASLLLVGCGGGGGDAPDSSAAAGDKAGMAQAQAINSGLASGQVYVSSTGGSFPTSLTSLRPDDTIIQAVLNGNDIHLSFTHYNNTFAIHRTITCTLRKTSAWVENVAARFVAAGTATSGDGALEGLISHIPDMTSSSFATGKMIYKITSGIVTATKMGEKLKIEFSSDATTIIAQAYSSHSPNQALSNGSHGNLWVSIESGLYTSNRTVYMNLVKEDEIVA